MAPHVFNLFFLAFVRLYNFPLTFFFAEILFSDQGYRVVVYYNGSLKTTGV